MSFITRCPDCGTAFKLAPEQLKIADGWVRCGHCQQVFDATLDLQPWWPGQEESTLAPAPTPAAQPPESLESPKAAEPPAPTEPMPQVGPVLAAPAHAPDEAVLTPQNATRPAAAPTPTEPLAPPSFVRQAQRRAWWRKPWVRAVLLLLVFGLAALLLAQAGLHWRDRLATQIPETKPVLEALCAPIDCKVEPPLQLDAVVIDSSVLLRRSEGRYNFNVVIRNKSDLQVAAPALELTLTAIDDQVLVRRVLLPAEWPHPAEVLAPRSESSLQFDLALEHGSDQVMTGYRAVLFYP